MSKLRIYGSFAHEKVGDGDGDEIAMDVQVDEKAVFISSGPWTLWMDAISAGELSAALRLAAEESIKGADE